MNESFKNSEFILDATRSVGDIIYHVYNQGYEDGKESVQIDESTAYERGLNDAWELARKLSNLGFNDTRKEIFGEKYGLSINIIKDFSVDEVADKIKEYEEKQELVEKIKVYYEPVMHKPGYVWLSDRHLQMINIEALAEALKFDQEYPALVDVKEETNELESKDKEND